jgi:site-specific DNA-adenine methylase
MLMPFFKRYGTKGGLAKLYGPPRYDHVIEPFAGGAGYSCYWEPPKVTLVEMDQEIVELWKYLKHVSAAEIVRLPTNISHIDELPSWVPAPAKSLIGLWFNRNPARPAAFRSPFAKNPNRQYQYWSETTKCRMASQVHRTRHWTIIHGSYEQAPNTEAHWFIDPPYSGAAGRAYRCNEIDYEALWKWCKSRPGFVQVCEHWGATGLPFDPLATVKTHWARGSLIEALCEIDNRPRRRSK